jgi:alanine racemase
MSTEPHAPSHPVPPGGAPTPSPGKAESGHAPDPDLDPRRLRAWMEVDRQALASNLRRVRSVLEGVTGAGKAPGLLPMVKAEGYGVGALGAVEALRPVGVAGFGVAAVDEGLALRAAGIREPIQVFSPLLPRDVGRALAAGMTPSLSDSRTLASLESGAEGAFEVELDTGMGRAGVLLPGAGLPVGAGTDPEGWATELVDRVAEGPLRWDGVFTHLHSADEEEPVARASVQAQVERFQAAVRVLDRVREARGLPPLRTHVANSAGALRFPELMASFDRVRPGVTLYGGGVGADQGLAQVVAVRARVVRVVQVVAGTTAGYGATYRASRSERWATLALGYGDGLPRALSGKGWALVQGVRVPMVGRISMDMCVVDVTEVPGAGVGDVATLVGQDGDQAISLDEVAEAAGTIHYEILTGWAPRLPRIWHGGGADPAPPPPNGADAR